MDTHCPELHRTAKLSCSYPSLKLIPEQGSPRLLFTPEPLLEGEQGIVKGLKT